MTASTSKPSASRRAPDAADAPEASQADGVGRASDDGSKGGARQGRPPALDEMFTPARRKPTVARIDPHSPRVRQVLRAGALFDKVSDEDFERFYALLRWRQVAARARLLAGGERSPWVFLILEGTAKVHHESASGAQVIYSICGSGELLGEMSAIDGQGHSATVTMLELSTLGAVGREEFLSFLLCVPQASLNLAAITSRRLRAATDRIQLLSRLDVTGRLAAQLLLFAAHYGQPCPPQSPLAHRSSRAPEPPVSIELHLRQSDLADLIGASRVRVNQALHQLRRSGHLAISANRITLLDIAALRARCE